MRGVFGLALVLVAGGVLWYAIWPQSFKAAVAAVQSRTGGTAAAGPTRNGA